MIRSKLLFTACIATLAACGAGVRADEAADDAAKKLGLKLVEHLPEIKVDVTLSTHFEMRFNGDPVGYTMATLRGVQTDKGPRYEYSDVSLIRGPNGQTRELHTAGVLDRHFRPETVTWVAISRSPNGTTTEVKETLRVEEKEVSLNRGDSNEMSTSTLPKPKERFVHIAGYLFSLLPVRDGQTFRLQEFDTEKKEFVWRTYRARKNRGSEMRLSVMDEKGADEAAYYAIAANGDILEHGISAAPFIFVHCTAERIDEIKKEWAKAKVNTKSPTKPADPKK